MGWSAGGIANLVAPGSGVLVGPVVGYGLETVSNYLKEKKFLHYRTRLSLCLRQVRISVFHAFLVFWELLGYRHLTNYGLDLGGKQFLDDAWKEWNASKPVLPPANNGKSLESRLSKCRKYVTKWGPQPEAVDELLTLYLTRDFYEKEKAEHWSRVQLKLFPCYATTFQTAANVALADGRYDDYLKCIAAGIERFPNNQQLQEQMHYVSGNVALTKNKR